MKSLLVSLLCVGALILSGCGDSDGTESQGETKVSVEQTQESTTEEEVQEGDIALGEFSADTLEGQAATQEIFQDSELTMLNIWATYCGPCLQEMPGLGSISDAYDEERFQIVGLVTDVYSQEQSEEIQQIINQNIETAKAAVEATGADYTHLLLNQALYEKLAGQMQYVPTSIFLDREGRQVGEVYTSARSEEDWEEIIESMLLQVEGEKDE